MSVASAHEFGMVEIRVRSVERAMAFYRAVFGWEMTPLPGGQYAFADPGKEPVVGLLEVAEPEAALGVIPYLLTPSIDATLADVERLGGSVVVGRSEWGAIGWWAHTVDPWGNQLALLETVNPWAPSFRAPARHPVVWAELRAPDLPAAVRYYRQLAGWSFQIKPEIEDFAFRSAGSHPVGVGLVGGERAQALAGATMYVRVEDVGAASERFTRAGGSLSPRSKAAPETGRFRLGYDPDGNALGLFQERTDGP